MEINHIELSSIKERIVRLEEKFIAADKALELARQSLSATAVVSTITILISILALVIVWIEHT